MKIRHYWLIWITLTGLSAAYFAFAVVEPRTSAKKNLVPGETTHGHYQIELSCNACHTQFMGVKQDACTRCHQDELKQSRDTHPASKFNDPANADRLAKLDAQKCTTCHREHVPDQTQEMGLTLPEDYCFHCHEDVAEQRPSHEGMSHDSCATAGCHNYHDNRALYEKFLFNNRDQPPVLDHPVVSLRSQLASATSKRETPLGLTYRDADAPLDLLLREIVTDWSDTSHARVGVNCRDCHDTTSEDGKTRQWHNNPTHESCAECHPHESQSFGQGRHGMRLAEGMTPMRPLMARLPMHEESHYKTLDCSACHQPHRYDTHAAAVEACMSCHNDEHTRNYKNSVHFQLWKEEQAGTAEAGSGVSCATCHMPRVEQDGEIFVQHNQNGNLRPNEKMIRSVCMSCHGLEFSLNSLADSLLIERCFDGRPSITVESAQMAKRWFEQNERQKNRRKEH